MRTYNFKRTKWVFLLKINLKYYSVALKYLHSLAKRLRSPNKLGALPLLKLFYF